LERVVPKTVTPVFVSDAVQSILMKMDVGTELVLTVVLRRIQMKNEFGYAFRSKEGVAK
jgi:hypothetical protein